MCLPCSKPCLPQKPEKPAVKFCLKVPHREGCDKRGLGGEVSPLPQPVDSGDSHPPALEPFSRFPSPDSCVCTLTTVRFLSLLPLAGLEGTASDVGFPPSAAVSGLSRRCEPIANKRRKVHSCALVFASVWEDWQAELQGGGRSSGRAVPGGAFSALLARRRQSAPRRRVQAALLEWVAFSASSVSRKSADGRGQTEAGPCRRFSRESFGRDGREDVRRPSLHACASWSLGVRDSLLAKPREVAWPRYGAGWVDVFGSDVSRVSAPPSLLLPKSPDAAR